MLGGSINEASWKPVITNTIHLALCISRPPPRTITETRWATTPAHDRHEGHSVAMFRDRFWLSLLLTIAVVIWSTDVQEWLATRPPCSRAAT